MLALSVTFWLGAILAADAATVAVAADPGRQHLDLAHHAAIFVFQNVAVIDEGSEDIGIAEVHSNRNAVVRSCSTPVRNIHGVAQRRVVYRLPTVEVHQVQFIDHPEALQQLDGSVHRSSIDIRISIARQLQQALRVQVSRRLLNGLNQCAALWGQPYPLGFHLTQ
jgi:hypothetical protein